ncbi:MAG TPA: GntR family transcriptional regulator [Candidatus Acidoferrales bacterium]|nr:GntR family transcriptional regulator [Candidatus Acidoferrales bacterium]
MSRNQRNGQYAYRRIQDVIRKRIESGKLRAGDIVESERELARIHKVSLMTARHALAELAREGVVERKHGAGTFVAPPKIHFNKLMSYTEQMSSRGLSARSKIVRLSSNENDPEIAARLSLPSTSRLAVVQRVRRADDEPFALETCYLSTDQFPGIATPSLERGSIFDALEREYGVNLAYADEEIDATDADQRTAELLSIPRGTPLLRMRQLIYSSKGIPTIYVVGLYRSGRHTLLIRRFR